MNKAVLTGILKNIQYSHTINDVEFYKADLIVDRGNGKEDLINIKFKKFSCTANEGDKITIIGNVRTYSTNTNNKNKVNLYVFTYMDAPTEEVVPSNNYIELEGNICKINQLKKTFDGKDVLDFILVTNIPNNGRFLNAYIPCVAWGKKALDIYKHVIGDKLHIVGEYRSREYRKYIDENNFEIRIANEINVNSIIEGE